MPVSQPTSKLMVVVALLRETIAAGSLMVESPLQSVLGWLYHKQL